ncbi:MAG: YraN family protein [Rhizobiales bacterium]|nr:YraN family protein [Hyphomicrobiales bacterium]MBO6699432.1 YraN family protein [Hyphomicrobiales bacterium]MBO6736970.1 YraN family protein [Hyphomicrobiales bacterium]MBO6911956.1 YraN family protein [Hyphomicrobiales bacterium]MBO6957055.1 YraN family protein [Hyphomicrobiales bacterium]
MADRQKAYRTGLQAEEIAARFLRSLGLEEIDRRARMAGGEIDLVVEDAETLVFVEVKARARLSDGVEAVSARQQSRIRAGLRAWLAAHDEDGARMASQNVRCDVVVVAPGHDPLHIPNAFSAAEDGGF